MQVHRDVQRDEAQRGRAAGRGPEADPAEAEPRQEAAAPGQQGQTVIEAAQQQDRSQPEPRPRDTQ